MELRLEVRRWFRASRRLLLFPCGLAFWLLVEALGAGARSFAPVQLRRARSCGRGPCDPRIGGGGARACRHPRRGQAGSRGASCLRVGYNSFSASEMRTGLAQLGLHDTMGLPKIELGEALRAAGIRPRDLLGILRGRKRDAQNRKPNSKYKRPDLWHFTPGQLRIALRKAGYLERTEGWAKVRLITVCRNLRLHGDDVEQYVGKPGDKADKQAAQEVLKGGGGRGRGGGGSGRRQRRGSSASSRSGGRQDSPWEWYKDDFLSKPSYEDEYYEERRQRYRGPGRGGGRGRGRHERGLGWDYKEAEDDEEDGGWDEVNDAWFDELCANGPAPPSGRRERAYSWSSAPRRPKPVETSRPSRPREEPDEAMARAVREGWKEERLSRSQAASLLGLALRPTQEEVREARRQMVLRWHPDRNPDDPSAPKALALALAACGVLQ